MQGTAKHLPIEGSGTVKWRTLMQDGTHHTLALLAFYMPSTSQQLLSPQHFLQHGTFSTLHSSNFLLKTPNLLLAIKPK